MLGKYLEWNMTIRTRILALAMGLALAGTVRAEHQFTALFGQSWNGQSDLHYHLNNNTDVTYHDILWLNKSFVDPIYYDLRYTYFLERYPRLGFAVDFTHAKMYAVTTRNYNATGTLAGKTVAGPEYLDSHVKQFSLSHGINFLTFNAVYRFYNDNEDEVSYVTDDASGMVYQVTEPAEPTWTDWVQPYIGIGLGTNIPHVESTLAGQAPFEQYQAQGITFNTFLGVLVPITQYFGLNFEYKFTCASITVNIPGGTASVQPLAHQLTFGPTLRW